ncbi:MAG TPA: PDZ domain-containing protein [Gammaproteobacteria bacterium]|nr:PDZ domain-containing protein [Gammaproteobacteria bacterium]
MRQPLLFLVAGLVAGFAVSAWLGPRHTMPGAASESPDLARRVASLEASLQSDAARLTALASEVARLRAAVAAAPAEDRPAQGGAAERAVSARRTAAAEQNGGELVADSSEGAAPTGPPFRGRGRFDAGESRIDRFIAAGFSADRAAYLDRRASELRMQALESQYEAVRAARSGRPQDAPPVEDPEQALRTELGDADYERYLTALGRPTRVPVRNILASSPAEQAGLQAGDEITGYDGHRVFDVADLNRLTLEGQPGQNVAIDIVRNGEPMQIFVPRGPLGITGGRGRFGGGP